LICGHAAKINVSLQDIPKYSCNVKEIFSQKGKKSGVNLQPCQWSQKQEIFSTKYAHFDYILPNLFFCQVHLSVFPEKLLCLYVIRFA